MVIQIDAEPQVKLPTATNLLMTNGRLFVGGRPGHRGIRGCMSDLVVDKVRLQLARRKMKFCHDNDV